MKVKCVSEEPRPPFDSPRANAMVGKIVLIVLTYVDANGTLLSQVQMHGEIMSADQAKGFQVALGGSRAGTTQWLPPDLRPFKELIPGTYTEPSSGEVVIDPDFSCSWTVEKPSPNGQSNSKSN